MDWSASAAVIFFAGAALGSFLNVVAVRWAAGEKPTGRSRCPECQQNLRWWELVPLVSYMMLQGKCARCQASLSWQYPLVEAAVGALFVLTLSPLLVGGMHSVSAVLTVVILSLLIILLLIDLRTMLLPDSFVFVLTIVVVSQVGLQWWYSADSVAFTPWAHIQGVVIGSGFLGFLWLVTKGRGIGLGDVKLMVPVGILTGPLGAGTILFLAFVGGGLYGVYLLLSKRAHLKTAVPFGPFLIAATIAVIVIPALPLRFWTLLLGLPSS